MGFPSAVRPCTPASQTQPQGHGVVGPRMSRGDKELPPSGAATYLLCHAVCPQGSGLGLHRATYTRKTLVQCRAPPPPTLQLCSESDILGAETQGKYAATWGLSGPFVLRGPGEPHLRHRSSHKADSLAVKLACGSVQAFLQNPTPTSAQ